MGRALSGRLRDALDAVEEAHELAATVPAWMARVGRDHAVYNEVNLLMELGRMDDARAVLEREAPGGRAQPGWVPFAAARLEYRAGNLDALERWLDTPIEVAQSVEHGYIERLLRNMRALAALTRGDLATARVEAQAVEEIVEDVTGLVRLDMLDVLAAVQAAGGDVPGAVERLRTAVAEARAHGMLLVEQFLLVRMAGLDPATADLDRLDELAGQIDGDLAALRARHVRAVVEGGDLEQIAQAYEERGYASAADRIRRAPAPR